MYLKNWIISVRLHCIKIKLISGFAIIVMTGCIILILNSCNSVKKETNSSLQAKDTININEGVVTYAISYPDLNDSKLSPFLPGEISFVFKGNLSSYVIRAGMGTVKIVRLLDFDKQEFISLLIDTWGTNYASKETSEDIERKETFVKYEYVFTDDTDIYDGLTCNKAIVRNLNDNTETEIFYAPNIAINNWNSPYKDLNKLLIAYPFSENGMNMLLKATKIESKEIDSSFFTVKGDFTWVTSSQFNDHLRSLQK